MKNFFTFRIFLLFLLGIGNNVSAAQFNSRLSGITNVPTARNYRVGLWGARATWYDLTNVTDTTTLALPTYLDDVSVTAGDSIAVTATSYCQSLTLNGTLYTGSAFAVNGNITINRGGIYSLNNNAYCKNIYNYGKFWNCNKTNSGTGVLGVGFTNSGTSASITASTDSITIVNDSIMGWLRSASVSGSKGCGFFIEYSNQAKAVNITHSSGLKTPYVFSVCGLVPYWYTGTTTTATSTAATQNLNLYINESIALVASASPLEFSLQNSDVFTGYARTCTIAAGDTVLVGGYFHTKGAAPGASQGNMTYNINGCLDMAGANRSKNEFDLYTSATSPYVAVNVENGGTLVLGKVISLVQNGTGQTTAINTYPYSKVKFGFTTAVPSFSFSAGVTFPASLPNLSIATGTYNVTLPSSLTVTDSLTLTSGYLTLGSYNLTAGSIVGGSASSYVVTNGTGTLTQTALTTGTLFPIGTVATTGYAPATITPASSVPVSASVSAIPTGSFTGYSVNSNEWTLTPATATTAALALTPTSATNINTPLAIFSGVVTGNYTTATPATLSGNTYSASGIALAAAVTQYATGGSTVATAIDLNKKNSILIYSANNTLVVRNATVGDLVTVYGVSGIKVASAVVKDDFTTIILTPGIYIVKAGSTVQKVSVQ